jgi:hypothetical protein
VLFDAWAVKAVPVSESLGANLFYLAHRLIFSEASD